LGLARLVLAALFTMVVIFFISRWPSQPPARPFVWRAGKSELVAGFMAGIRIPQMSSWLGERGIGTMCDQANLPVHRRVATADPDLAGSPWCRRDLVPRFRGVTMSLFRHGEAIVRVTATISSCGREEGGSCRFRWKWSQSSREGVGAANFRLAPRNEEKRQRWNSLAGLGRRGVGNACRRLYGTPRRRDRGRLRQSRAATNDRGRSRGDCFAAPWHIAVPDMLCCAGVGY